MFQTQNRETINNTWKVAESSKIIMTTSVTRLYFTTQHKTCKTKTKTTVCKTVVTVTPLMFWFQDQDRFFWSQTGLVLRPTVSDHITALKSHYIKFCTPVHPVT